MRPLVCCIYGSFLETPSQFPDCDFDEAIQGLAEAVFLNTGQVCLCAERGPGWHIAPFDSEEEAISLANDTKYSLGAFFWTANLFIEFQQARKLNTDAIADVALENFVEMRDGVTDPRFLFCKKVELALEARVRYRVALVQDQILKQLCDGFDRLGDSDWDGADRFVTRRLTHLLETL